MDGNAQKRATWDRLAGRIGAVTSSLAARARLRPSSQRLDVGLAVEPERLVGVAVRQAPSGAVTVLSGAVRDLPGGLGANDPAFAASLDDLLRELAPGKIDCRVFAGLWNGETKARQVGFPRLPARQSATAAYWAAKKALGFVPDEVVVDIEPRRAAEGQEGDRSCAVVCLAGLTVTPFGLQNLLRRPDTAQEAGGFLANLHLGRDWSRLEVCGPAGLVYVRGLRTGFSVLARELEQALGRYPGGCGEASRVGNAPGLRLVPASPAACEPCGVETAEAVLRAVLLGGEALPDGYPGRDLDAATVLDLLGPALERLTRQVDMTLRHCRELCGTQAVTRLSVSGELGASRELVTLLGARLGLPCRALRVCLPGAPAVGPGLAHALGLALSGTVPGPNLLVTARQRAKAVRARRTAAIALGAATAVLLVVIVFTAQALRLRGALERERAALVARLGALDPASGLAALTRRLAVVRTRRQAVSAFAARNAVVGLWGEVLALAPPGVGIGTITTDFGRPGQLAPVAAQSAKRPGPRLDIEGLVSGEARSLEARLTCFVAALRRSPLFRDVVVKSSTPLAGQTGQAKGLRFALGLGLAEVGS